nr:hypothetical protein [Tanacetum cinerariifolium]
PSPDYVTGPEHADDEIVAEDQPYAEDALPTAQLPEYVPESDLEAHLEDDDDEDPEEDPVDYPTDGEDDGDDEEGSSEDDEDDDMASRLMRRRRRRRRSTQLLPTLERGWLWVTDSWDEIVETLQGAPVSTDTELSEYMREFETRVRQDTDEIYMRLDDEQSERQLLAGRLNMLFRDRRAHAYTRHLMETEARLSREAW